jgi:DHA2 family multidrug resistance protein
MMALKQLTAIVHRQAVVMSYGDAFFLLTVFYLGLTSLVFLLAKPANPMAGPGGGGGH